MIKKKKNSYLIPQLDVSDSLNWNFDLVKRHWVPHDPYTIEDGTEEYYRVKYLVAATIRPRSICEIGVKAGYSASAFLQAGTAEYYCGIDYNAGTYGGQVDYTMNYAIKTLHQYDVYVKIYNNLDSQTINMLPCGAVDLLHVDGDHSYEGCLHDIEMGIASECKWILVDDYDDVPAVKNASLAALDKFKIKEAYYVGDHGYRGNLLILNPATKKKK